MNGPDDAVTAAYQAAENFLQTIGWPPVDVTDLVITRQPDSGQQKRFSMAVTFLVPPDLLGVTA